MADQLATARPDLSVQNHAVPGYGTHQAATAFEQSTGRPAVVVYGYTDLHDGRNVGAAGWRATLERAGPGQPWTAPPTVAWSGHQLVPGPPTPYHHWPLCEHYALAHAFERAGARLQDRLLRTKVETTVQRILT